MSMDIKEICGSNSNSDGVLRLLVTADIHFERLDMSDIDKHKLYFESSIATSLPDAFIIAGDFCDNRHLRAESINYKQLIEFMTFIYSVCKRHKVPMYILEGTPSHDGKIIKNMCDILAFDNVTYVETASVHNIGGYSILFLPEQYSSSIDEFNKYVREVINESVNVLTDKVDICIFHGMFDFAIPYIRQVDSNFNQSRTILINTTDFVSKFVNIVSVGGHMHQHIGYNNVYYTSRFTNEKEQKHDGDSFGFKLLVVTNSKIGGEKEYRYELANIENKFLYKYKHIVLNFCDETTLGKMLEYVSELNLDINNTVFICRIVNNQYCRAMFKDFSNSFSMRYIKRKNIQVNTNIDKTDIDVVSSVVVTTEDLDILVSSEFSKLYKGGAPIGDDTMIILKGEANKDNEQ